MGANQTSESFSKLDRFLGIGELPIDSQRILKLYLFIAVFIQIFLGMGHSFVLLRYIQTFGYKNGSILISIIFLVQFLTDYPSGSLGDYIGQRIVLIISMTSWSIGYFIVSQVTSFQIYAIASVFFGIALAQQSGALESWLDNNYRLSCKDTDPDRKIYGFATSRIYTISSFAFGISFAIGGLISTFGSRQLVFLIVSLSALVTIPIVFIFVKDLQKSPEDIVVEKEKDPERYFKYLIGGFRYLFSSKSAFTLLTGFAIIDAITVTWFTIILFPIYFGYTGSDVGVGGLRSTIFIVGALISIYMANLSKKVSDHKLALFFTIQLPGLFLSAILIMTIVPMINEFNLLGMVLVLLFFLPINAGFGRIAQILRQRVLLEAVPSQYRNGIYSLIPTLATAIQIPYMIYVGHVIDKTGSIRWGLLNLTIFSLVGIFLLVLHQTTGQHGVEINKETSVVTTA